MSFLQEILGSNLAGIPPAKVAKDASPVAHLLAAAHIDVKALKMAVYGAFVSAPMSHYLVGTLQKVFAGKTSAAARAAQILASNLFIAPIQTLGRALKNELLKTSQKAHANFTVFLASMAVINGAKSLEEVKRTVKGGFFSVIRVGRQFKHAPYDLANPYVLIPLRLHGWLRP